MRAAKERKPVPVKRQRVRRGSSEDRERLRRELIGAASALFAEGGLEAVSMRAVAARVGVSPMTPYRYFAGKAELLSGLWQFVIRAVCEEMRTAIERHRSGRARQRASLDAFLAYWERNPDHYRLVYMTEQTTLPEGDTTLTDAPVYREIVELAGTVTRDFAKEIGAELTHAKVTGDIRLAMQLGYLHATLVNRRYPWSDRATLREAYIEQIVLTVERCLLHGPNPPARAAAAANAPRRTAPRGAGRRRVAAGPG